jgi:hypothetical protein
MGGPRPLQPKQPPRLATENGITALLVLTKIGPLHQYTTGSFNRRLIKKVLHENLRPFGITRFAVLGVGPAGPVSPY